MSEVGRIGASIAGLFYPQERTSSRRPSMSASGHSEPVEQDAGQKSRLEATASGFFLLKKLKILRMNQAHRSAGEAAQRFDHPRPLQALTRLRAEGRVASTG